jgi:hypothetical protein
MIKIAPALLKDRAIFLGWIAGLILAVSLLWTLSFSLRAEFLMQSANRILAATDDGRRLSAPLSRPFAGPVPLGCWYYLAETGSLFYVFVIMRNGILIPLGAEISEQGKVVDITPLGSHAFRVMDRIPRGLIQVYIRRIEFAVAKELGER